MRMPLALHYNLIKRCDGSEVAITTGRGSVGDATKRYVKVYTTSIMVDMSNHFYLGSTKVVYGTLYLLVYHQYSLVNEIGPPHKRDTFA